MKYTVLHHSIAWTEHGLIMKSFETRAEAELYIKGFKGIGNWHKNDTCVLVENLKEYIAEPIDTVKGEVLHGFKVS